MAALYLGHRNIQHTVRYTELSPTRFKDFNSRARSLVMTIPGKKEPRTGQLAKALERQTHYCSGSNALTVIKLHYFSTRRRCSRKTRRGGIAGKHRQAAGIAA
jgi:hypothetical protein